MLLVSSNLALTWSRFRLFADTLVAEKFPGVGFVTHDVDDDVTGGEVDQTRRVFNVTLVVTLVVAVVTVTLVVGVVTLVVHGTLGVVLLNKDGLGSGVDGLGSGVDELFGHSSTI